MSDLLGRLDAAIDGLCPCGADPRPGSAYCSYDCEPNHVSVHTDQREAGEFATPMRWRPDLVTAVDDTDLTPIDAPRPGYSGLYNPSVFRRGDGRLHLRLDDGHRFVGCDVDAPSLNGVLTPTAVTAINDAWRRLERELGNGQQVDVDADPWADMMAAYSRMTDRATASSEAVVLGHAAPAATGRIYIGPAGADPSSVSPWAGLGSVTSDDLAWDEPDADPAGDVLAFWSRWANGTPERSVTVDLRLPEGAPLLDAIIAAQSEAALRERARVVAQRSTVESFGIAIASMRPAFEQFNRVLAEQVTRFNNRYLVALQELERSMESPQAENGPAGDQHPMLAAIEARRNRNTRPGLRQRAPRQINPGRR